MNFNDEELVALKSGRRRIGIFFALDTSPQVRLWLGYGKIKPGVSVIDPSGTTYSGCGEIQNVPAISQLINGAAERVGFQMSGVSGQVLQAATGSDANAVKGKRASVGFALMGSNWALLGLVHWCASYVADYTQIDQQAGAVTDDIVRTLTLSCSTRFTGRRRPSRSYLSDQDQEGRFPGDLSCSLVGNYAHGFNKNWPVFS